MHQFIVIISTWDQYHLIWNDLVSIASTGAHHCFLRVQLISKETANRNQVHLALEMSNLLH